MTGKTRRAFGLLLFASFFLAFAIGSASACSWQDETCSQNSDCCAGLQCNTAAGKCALPPSICEEATANQIFWLAGMAALGTGIMIALAYMFGEVFQNARVLTWAKTEIMQVFVSLIIVGAVLGTAQLFCTLEVGEISSIFTPQHLPKIYENHQTASIYSGAIIYLENLMDAAQTNMRSLRYLVGAYEIRTSYTSMTCKNECWISLMGTNEAAYGGESLQLAIANNLLSTATISYLTAAFEYFTLQYIVNGLFLVLLPLAIVMRSIPFMRQFAGALVAIFIALYIMYPTMLLLNAMMAPGMVNNLSGSSSPPVFYLSDCKGLDLFTYKDASPGAECEKQGSTAGGKTYTYDEAGLGGSWSGISAEVPYAPNGAAGDSNRLEDYVRTSGLIFLLTVFLAAFNFIVIAAVARGLSHFLGEEVDISRLGQMI